MISKKRVRKIINDFIEMWSLDLTINRIEFWNRDGEAEYEYFPDGSSTLRLNPDQHIEELMEDIFHELGHAIIHQYSVPRKYLALFRSKSPQMSVVSSSRIMDEGELHPPKNFVSWYGRVSGVEDFCECLSAYVTNDYKLSGKIIYKDWEHNLNNEPILKRKFQIIEDLLDDL